MSGDTVNDGANGEFSTWSSERLEAHAATLPARSAGAPEGPEHLVREGLTLLARRLADDFACARVFTK